MPTAIKSRRVTGSVKAVVDSFRSELVKRGIKEYAEVDHGRDMAAMGVQAFPAYTLVFGNPRLGSRLLAETLDLVVDIPLRAAFYQAGPEVVVVWRDMHSLLQDYPDSLERLKPLAEQVNQVLDDLVTQALVPFSPSTRG